MRRERRGLGGAALVLAFLVGLLLFGDGRDDERAAVPVAASETVPVVRVVDGDTIVVALGGGEETIRYIGVDTPETVKPGAPVECFGPQASALNKQLVSGEEVRLDFDREPRDRYGRLLAYVHRGDLFVNAELIRRGAARTLEIEPNTAHGEQLARLQTRAAAAGRGLWGAC